jgi:pyruvate/2-oxoglutarate dehydrogenase complex dihydrolipoamide dehydrogenase (E3) component
MVASAYAAHMARRAGDFGVMIPGSIQVDMKAVKARKEAILGKSRDGIERWLRGMTNCTVFHESARFVSGHEIVAGAETISADQIFINVGGRAIVPEFPGVHEISYLTNSSMLELEEVPQHLVVVGGSYIGLEFAQMFRRFGSEVNCCRKGSSALAA